MKKKLIMGFIVFSLAGCSNGGKSDESSNFTHNVINASKIEELKIENANLKEQLEISRGGKDNEVLVNNIRETFNLTFKIISAMEYKKYDFIQSVSSPKVKISQENNSIIVNNGENSYEVSLLEKININELEFRGYNQKDENHFMLALAKVNTQEGSEGAIELNFDFIRSENGNWKFDGLLTN